METKWIDELRKAQELITISAHGVESIANSLYNVGLEKPAQSLYHFATSLRKAEDLITEGRKNAGR